MPDLIGQSLGRYHILDQLGEGGMATVYKAYDTRLERDVAVKVIRVDQFTPASLERVLQRFEREAKALARLSHPNLVGVIDYGDHEGVPYLVMEYLPGGTLKKRLGKPMPWAEAVRLLLPIARGLAYAHQHGVVHRDVKPSNILIGDSGEPMLGDFGIAKILEGGDAQTLTGTGIGVGTPEYMAPEQWTGQAGPESDIYSLGVVFYELVTGRKPYTADTPAAILLKQATEPLPRPAQFAAGLPEAVEKVLYKALARKPEDRYADMAAFAGALEGLLEGQSQTARSVVKPAVSKPLVEDSMATIEQAPTRDELPSAPAKAPSKIRSQPSQLVPLEQPGKPYSQSKPLSQIGPKGKRWIPIAILVVLLGVGLTVGGGLILGGGLLKMGQQGQGPLAGLAADTATSTNIPIATSILNPTNTPIPINTPTMTLGTIDNPIVMAFSPSTSSQMLTTGGQALADKLKDLTGYEFMVTVPTSYAALIEAMGSGNAQVGWLPPAAYVVAKAKGYADVAAVALRNGADHYNFQFIANIAQGFTVYYDPATGKDTADAATALVQFAGKKPCWTDPLSASGYLVPSGFLAANGIMTLAGAWMQSHPTVVKSVYLSPKGEICNFGATYVPMVDISNDFTDVNNKVVTIWVSDPIIPNDTVAFATGLPDDMRLKIITALLTIGSTPDGLALLKGAGYSWGGVKDVDDSFFDGFRVYLQWIKFDFNNYNG